MFGSQVSIGFDPTINVRPIQPLQVSRQRVVYDSARAGAAVPKPIPKELEDLPCSETSMHDLQLLPDSVSIDSLGSQLPPPTFITPPHDDNPFVDLAPNLPTPIGEIWVHDVCYEILEVLFSSGGFLGQGTMIYLGRCGEELYIIKDHWVENPSQEAKMMKWMKGVCGMPNLVDSWTVEVRPGIINITSWYRSEESRIHMKSIRTHVWTVISPCGRHLSKFRTKCKFVQCLRDILFSKYILSLARSMANMKISPKGSSSEGRPSSRCQPIQHHNRRSGEWYPGNAYRLGICGRYHCHAGVQCWWNGQ